MAEKSSLFRFAGWSAYTGAGAVIVGVVGLIAFFILGEPFGTINDASSVAIALANISVLFALHRYHHTVAPALSLVALIIGVAALLVAAVYQTLLVFNVISYEQTAVITPVAFGIFGISLLVYGYLAYLNNSFSRKMAVLGMVSGAGYMFVIIGFLLGQQNHPLVYVGGLAAVIAFPPWAILLGRAFLKSN